MTELKRIVSKYLDSETVESFDEFADSYRRVSGGKFGASPEVLKTCLAIDAALSVVYLGNGSYAEFRESLGNVVC